MMMITNKFEEARRQKKCEEVMSDGGFPESRGGVLSLSRTSTYLPYQRAILPFFHYMHAHANQRKCYLWHIWHTSILYTSRYWCLPDCFFSSSNASLSCYPTVCIFLCSQLNRKTQYDQLSVCVRWWQLKVTSSKSPIKTWGNYWYFHLYLYFHFNL